MVVIIVAFVVTHVVSVFALVIKCFVVVVEYSLYFLTIRHFGCKPVLISCFLSLYHTHTHIHTRTSSTMNGGQCEMVVLFALLLLLVVVGGGDADLSKTNCILNTFERKAELDTSNLSTNRVYQFECQASDLDPELASSRAHTYDVLDLSPNFFTSIPVAQLCAFNSTDSIDLSHNRLDNMNDLAALRCLTYLSRVDLSNNRIETAFTAQLFDADTSDISSNSDDDFTSQLVSLNLTNNRIKVVRTGAFIRSDGTSRFPNLAYLGLAHNMIVDLDLLWPLTLPAVTLFVDLKLNPIENLVNELGLSFKDLVFENAMTRGRYVDITNNKLQFMDDTNILQYGVTNADELYAFLQRIANYDLRQSNFMPTFICYCPLNAGLRTVLWYRNVTARYVLDTAPPIYQLYCSNYKEPMFIFDFPCGVSTSK